jgi:hypothetical protein
VQSGDPEAYRAKSPSVSDSGPIALVSAQPLAYMADLPRPQQASDPYPHVPSANLERYHQPQLGEAHGAAPAPAAAALAPAPAPAPAKLGWLIPVAILGALFVVGIVGVIGWFVVSRRAPSAPEQAAPEPASAPQEPAKTADPAAGTATTPEPAADPAESAAAATSAAAAAAPATDALVTFECDPGCDVVECDGKKLESVTDGVRLAPGVHRCRATKEGYLPRSQTLTVKAGEDQKQAFQLVKREERAERPRAPAPGPATPRTEKPKKPCGTFINPCK